VCLFESHLENIVLFSKYVMDLIFFLHFDICKKNLFAVLMFWLHSTLLL